jgi:hypothetical protein
MAVNLPIQMLYFMETIILTVTLIGSVATAWAIQWAILQVCLKAIDPTVADPFAGKPG